MQEEEILITQIDTDKSEKSLKDLAKEMKQLGRALDAMEKDTKEYDQVLAKLTKTQELYNLRVDKMKGSLELTAKRIDSVTKVASGAVGAFGTLSSSMSLLGLSSDEADAGMQKMVQILTLVQSLSAFKDLSEGVLGVIDSFNMFADTTDVVDGASKAFTASQVIESTAIVSNSTAVGANTSAKLALLSAQTNLSLANQEYKQSLEEEEKKLGEINTAYDIINESLERLRNQKLLLEANAANDPFGGMFSDETKKELEAVNKQIMLCEYQLRQLGQASITQSAKVAKLGSSFTKFKVSVVNSLNAIKAAFVANPIGFIIGIITAAVALLYSNWDKISTLWKDTDAIEGQIDALTRLNNKLKDFNDTENKILKQNLEIMEAEGKTRSQMNEYELKELQRIRDINRELFEERRKQYDLATKNGEMSKEMTEEYIEQIKKLEDVYISSNQNIQDFIHRTNVERIKDRQALIEQQKKDYLAMMELKRKELEALEKQKEEEYELIRINRLAILERIKLQEQLNKDTWGKTGSEESIQRIKNQAEVELEVLNNQFNSELKAFEWSEEEKLLIVQEFNFKRVELERKANEEIQAIRDADLDAARENIEAQIAIQGEYLAAKMEEVAQYYDQREGGAIDSAFAMQEAYQLDASWSLRLEYFDKTMALYAKDSAEYIRLEKLKTKEHAVYANQRQNAETKSIRAGMDFAAQAANLISGLAKEGTKAAKGAASAETIINGVSASIGLWRGYAPLGPLGIAPMVAQQALLAGQTALALKQIWSTNDSGGTSPDVSAMIAPSIPVTQNVLTSSDIQTQEQIMSKYQAVLVVDDFNSVNNARRIVVSDNKY